MIKKQLIYSGRITGYNAKGESGKQELIISLDRKVSTIPLCSNVEIRVKKNEKHNRRDRHSRLPPEKLGREQKQNLPHRRR
ncbi:hypothetical protein KY366_00260 [Candidatus Woesearchaeota archaeon]|nr:hypothetical protein [Candidatus Woesearchaeota archaeon]